MSNMSKKYSFNDLAGCVVQRKARQTGTLVGVYNSEQAGLDDDPACSWSCVCEFHSTLVGHSSLKKALGWSVEPESWCEFCRARDQKYVTDEATEPFTFNDFWKNNEGLSPRDQQDVAKMEVNETLTLGGGATAETIIRRVS